MPVKKKAAKKKAVKKTAKKTTSGVPTTLIITEKPQAAEKIAAALSGGKDDKFTDKNKVSYYEFNKDGRRIVVVCAVGHLFGIMQVAARGPFPNFEVEWRPNYEKKGSAFTKKYLDVIKKIQKDADEFVVATDYDTEGEVIGWNVVRFICKQKDAKRMKFSSLTKDSLENAWENLEPSINWGEAYAGETRHYLDWFYGINLSRGLMKALSQTGKFRILSVGRVQGPALKIIVDKEREIRNFKSEPYWQVFLKVVDRKGKWEEVKYPKDLFGEGELLKFKQLRGKGGFATTEIKEVVLEKPKPFDLTTLQTEAYKFVGLTPSQTLQVAQRLYLDGLISYPRTSSQKYPETIGYDNILKKLKKYTTLGKYATNKKPSEGKKTDPAHPAIYPTGEMKKISESDRKIYDLIVKRFISCFADDAIIEEKRLSVDVNGIKFKAKGAKIKEKKWMHIYPSKFKEENIESLEGDVDVREIRIEEKQTQPPRRYSAASLVRELEKRNLGTKATRANIIETLYSRGYISEKSIETTPLGERVIETLEEYSPLILDEELTRKVENEMEGISDAKKDWDKKEDKVIEESKKTISEVAKSITENLEKIGEGLAEAHEKSWEAEKENNTVMDCPKCKKGKMIIRYGKQYKRYFLACDAYPDCKTTFSLPPGGMIKPSKIKNHDDVGHPEKCEACGFPLLISLKKGRRPWKFCFNPECPTREKVKNEKGGKDES